MKRISLLFICFMLFSALAYSDIIKSVTMLTNTYKTFDPVKDLNISLSNVSSTNYELSDKKAFSVTHSNKISDGLKYTLQALKTGQYTFKVSVTWKKGIGIYVPEYETSYITYKITVVDQILVNRITINYTEYDLFENQQVKLNVTVSPSDASNKSISWKSSNESVATVGANGLVTAIKEGICNITASTTDGSNLKVSCLIRVSQLRGDVNGDGKVDIADVTSLINIILENER